MHKTDLNLLRVFDALMTERNVTRAARRMGLSQPAMSNALSRLRTHFEDELFIRSGRGMEPTARAQSIAGPIKTALHAVEAVMSPPQSFDPKQVDRVVRIAMTDNSLAVLMADLLHRFRTDAPKLDLQIITTAPSDMLGLLDEGAVDLAIGVLPDIDRRHRAVPLYRDYLVGMCKRGKFGSGGPTLDEFADADHVLVAPRGGQSGIVDRLLAAEGRKRRIFLTLSQFLFAPYAVTKADLVVCLPARFAIPMAEKLDLALFEPPVPTTSFTVSLAWHQRDDADDTHDWLRETVLDVTKKVTGETPKGFGEKPVAHLA